MPQATRTFHDDESAFHGRYSKHVVETLFFAYRPFLAPIAVLLVVGLVGRFLLLSNANLIGYWVDHRNEIEATEFINVLALVTLVGFVCTTAFRILFSRLSASAISRIYDEVTIRTSRLPIGFFDRNPVGRIVTRFSSDYGNVFRLFGGPLAELFAIVFDLVSMLVLVTIASPKFLPIVVVIGCLDYLIYRLNRDRLRERRRELSASRSPSIAHFAETVQGASTIRVFARQRSFFRRFIENNGRYLDQRIKTSKAIYGFSLQMNAMTSVLLLATGLAGYWLVQEKLLTVGSLGVAFSFIILSGTSLQMFFEWLAQLEEAMTGVERLDDYLRRDLERGARLPSWREFPTSHPVYATNEEEALKRTKLAHAASASVQVEDLWLKYDDESPFVLKGISFAIRPGEKIGIVGRTGSGKTSLVQALLHLYPPTSGKILIDGQLPNDSENTDHARVDLSLFRRSIALISQEATLFRGTVRENLDLTHVHTDSELTEALDRVGLTEWISIQPQGLDSPIEERGRNLSAGERQLLCMARCLLQDAPVVIMDEATSAVDPRSEEILVQATKKFFADRTQIIIAHRLATLEYCDRVLWLDQGEVKMFDRSPAVIAAFRHAEL
ncbi:MAG TPA: ABC transporter ATP-binding protein [Bdellovibrionales bacterium]|nr:ABC transporter ATP-binding protein [Bdellovibrionales bacterium]